MNKELISVIVPVYNVQEYLSECIESLINQKYSNLEILLINDCSTDDSLKICKEYEKKDSRITVINLKKNSGVSPARNVGLKKCKGDYVYFMDSDDYISEDFLYNLISNTEEDCITVVNDYLPEGKYKIEDFVRHYLYGEFLGVCTRYLFKKDRLNHFFDEKVSFMEDCRFVISEIFHYSSIKVINKGNYFYRRNPNSLTRKRIDAYFIITSYYDSLDYMVNECESRNVSFSKKKISHRKVRLLFSNLYRVLILDDLKDSLKKLRTLKFNYKEFYLLDRIRMYFLMNPLFSFYFYLRLIIKKFIKGVIK